MRLYHIVFFFLVTYSFHNIELVAEGIVQLRPTAGNAAVIQIWDNGAANRNSFTYGAPDNKRLYFHIDDDLSEVVYFGLSGFYSNTNTVGANSTAMRFTIRRPDGTVFATYNDVLAPADGATTTTGHVDSYAEAVAGPAQLVGGTGYDAYFLDPDQPGDWWIEFDRDDRNQTKTLIELFDITVATERGQFDDGNVLAAYDQSTYDPTGILGSTNGTAINGRVFSQAWDVNMRDDGNSFEARLFVYTPDSVVLGIDFNGIQPFGFVVACNSTGTGNTGNVIQDRQSVAGNTTRPEYPLFLNDPDPNVYPTGTLPTLTAPDVDVTLCTNYEISFFVSQAGTVEFLLDLDATENSCSSSTTTLYGYVSNGLFEQNSRDVALALSVT